MIFNGFVGPAYTLKSVNINNQKCVNLIPEIDESGSGKDGATIYYKSAYGYVQQFDLGTGPIRLIHEDYSGRIFVVSGNRIYKLTKSGSTWTSSFFPVTMSTSTGPVRAKSSKSINGDEYTVFVDGYENYFYYINDIVGTPELFTSYALNGFPPVPEPLIVEFIDGYFIYCNKDQFFVSELGTFSVDPLSFASSEGSPDQIVSMIANNRELIIFNETTTEFFYNSGNADFPFERISGGFIEKGCCATYSVAKIEGIVFWLGQDNSGRGQVFAMSGHSPQRISTHAIEYAISTYADISSATSYTYQQDGHSFYVLNFAEATWVYDLSTKMWHERAYSNAGVLERHRFDCSLYSTTQKTHYFGDYVNGKVYVFDTESYSDNGNELVRLRRAPHVSNQGDYLFHHAFALGIETGIGRETGLGVNPQVMLRFSDDSGHTWSSESWTSAGQNIGGVGEYKTEVEWRRLGASKNRVYEIKITDPVKVNIYGAKLDLSGGKS